MDLVEAVYKATTAFPRQEIYGLTSQIRRAVISVPSNIAEGQAQDSSRQFQRYLTVAYGSLREMETQLLIAFRPNYLGRKSTDDLTNMTAEVARLLNGLKNSLSRKT